MRIHGNLDKGDAWSSQGRRKLIVAMRQDVFVGQSYFALETARGANNHWEAFTPY